MFCVLCVHDVKRVCSSGDNTHIFVPFAIGLDPASSQFDLLDDTRARIEAEIEASIQRQFTKLYPKFKLANTAVGKQALQSMQNIQYVACIVCYHA